MDAYKEEGGHRDGAHVFGVEPLFPLEKGMWLEGAWKLAAKTW